MKRKHVFGLLVSIIAMFSVIFAIQAKMELNDIKNGVVRITTINEADGMPYQGTGFAIGLLDEEVSYIVTNYHVIDGASEIYLYRDESDMTPLEVTDIVLKVNDIAVLKLPEPVDYLQPLIIETEQRGESGDKILALGFPALSDALDPTYTGYPDDITVTSGIISKVTEDEKNIEFYQIDAVISGGNSGGPLVNEEGYVIGINSFGLMDSEDNPIGYNGSILLDNLIEELDDHGIDYQSSASVREMEAMQVANMEDEEDEEDVEEKDTGSNGGLTVLVGLISIFVVLLIGIVTIIIVVTNKRKHSGTTTVVHVQETVIAKKEAQIFGVTGFHAGKVFSVEGLMTFGRNPESKICFASDYPGISGNHCLLQFDEPNELFILSDMGSTYGTFLENGQMIQRNTKIALNSGDRFYLTDPKDMFEVRYS